jgi:hypothetical protein
VIIKAAFPAHTSANSLLLFDQTPRCSFERITFDGGGDQNLRLVEQSMQATTLFDTGCQYVECVFTNAGWGLVTGNGNNGGSEVSILRDKFSRLGVGVQPGYFNALDLWVQDCEIGNCVDGLSNNGKAGSFHAWQCLFHDNTNDIHIGNTEFFGFRNNVSTNSGRFLLAEGLGSAAAITLQENTVIDPQILPCVDDGNQGQLAAFDNTFLTRAGTVLRANGSSCDAFSMSNRFNRSSAESLSCRNITLDDQVITRPANSGTIILSAMATNVHRFVTNLWNGATSVDIQAAIYGVTNRLGQRPIVHIPWGTNNCTTSLVIPPGSDVQIEGDCFRNVLDWNGGSSGPVVNIGAGATTSLKHLMIEDGGRTTTGIVLTASNGALWSRRTLLQNSTYSAGACLLVRGCNNATIDLLDFQFGGTSVNGLFVDNSTAIMRLRGCATSDSTTLITLTNQANVCVEEIWYESNSAADLVHASGSGTFTLQGFKGAVNVTAGADGKTAIFTNWNGTALISQGSIRDKVIPANGTGSLWLNGLGFINVTSPLSPANALAVFNVNNTRSETNGDSTQISDYAAVSNALIRSTMAQIRSTQALQNCPTNAVRLESILVDKCNVSVLVK